MEPSPETKTRSVSPLKTPRKRKRIVISCTECHRRKQKCDRASPCANCVARNKQSLCHYENEAARKAQLLEEGTKTTSDGGRVFNSIKPAESESAAQISTLGYVSSNGANNTILGIFKKIESHDSDGSSPVSHQQYNSTESSGLREKYKSFVRQLPSKQYIEQLVETYFREVNFQYYPLDEGAFRDLLKDWHNLPFATLNKGPMDLPPDLQFFPALVFQILATALQFQPTEYDPGLDSLKYASAMSFDDLASDYSESGSQILNLLGKRHTTLVTVQAGFLRTTFLKNSGLIPESWHSLSQTIRDAQEIGLHKSTGDQFRRRKEEKPEDILENLWEEQFRKKMWLILSLWDVHMALVLGRPTTIDIRDGKPAFPIDAPAPKSRREVAPSPRAETDPPTPLTMVLWSMEIYAPLWDIIILEKEDPNQNNFAKVEKMHDLIQQVALHCPPFFRSQNPDLTFDSYPSCYWLPRARLLFTNGIAFTIMVLHRPYIFTSPSSRTSALKAGLDILRTQQSIFNLLNTIHFKMFSLVMSTFDAIVLLAAIYILHPYENVEQVDDTLQHFEWSRERFQMMSTRNSMAKSALCVLEAINVRLKKALKQPSKNLKIETMPMTPDSNTPQTMNHPSVSTSSNTPTSSQTNTSGYTLPTISNMTEATTAPATTPAWDTYSGLSNNLDFSNIAPLQPMHDLVFNDLGTINAGLDPALWNGPLPEGSWQFEGAFADDSFWGFMNTYQP